MGTVRQIKCLVLSLLYAGNLSLFGEIFHLPSPNGNPQLPQSYLQPTEPLKDNGGFGLLRENGTRYHGGIDIRPAYPLENGEPSDPIFAVASGTVVYVNDAENLSSYGRYVVIEHGELPLPIFSLYAHLASIASEVKIHKKVHGGQCIGMMGRSSNAAKIVPELAHLHLEMGLRLGSPRAFQKWYREHYFDSPNDHGHWNGLNLVSFDPLPILQNRGQCNVLSAVQRLETAFITRIYADKVPDFLHRYPALVVRKGRKIANEPNAYDVHWTWNGIPKAWHPHRAKVPANPAPQLLYVDKRQVNFAMGRGLLAADDSPIISLGPRFFDTLKKIFGE
ncbi:MAG: M23 family metallopeptidase [Puniceicoccales bacterium]|jgi:hypothetical protein|nr:M23 family metallopeptidase [Puniceicoccales bacterium]